MYHILGNVAHKTWELTFTKNEAFFICSIEGKNEC